MADEERIASETDGPGSHEAFATSVPAADESV
jgi:hypothetical protein